jgi:diaminobutyrate-2-oxoglutarate transaminase
MSMVLVRPELDVFEPGEHNGTFRGFMPAFVTATAALEHFWCDDALTRKVERDAAHVRQRLEEMTAGTTIGVRGRGLIQGLVLADPDAAARVTTRCFELGLVIERAGPEGEVVKLLPPLTIERGRLDRGLDILAWAIES